MKTIIAGNTAPRITGITSIQATVGEEVTFELTVTDADGDDVTLHYIGNIPAADIGIATGNLVTYHINWTPTSMEPMSLV